MFDHFQGWVYETYAPLFGQAVAALMSGFAVVIEGQMLLTPAGARYVERLDAGVV